MEIQKVFSDMYDEERIYSVLLTEDEMALFSEMEEAIEEEENKKGLSKGAKIAGTSVAGGAGAIVGAKYAGKALRGHAAKIREAAIEAGEFGGKAYKKNARMVNISRALEKPADAIVGAAKKTKEAVINAGKSTKGTAKVAAEWIKAHPGKAIGIAAGVTAAGTAAGVGVKKLRDRKNNK